MERKIISRKINLRYPVGSLDPTEINEQFLYTHEIIDDDNLIDKEILRIGSLGTNIIFLNESKDEIKVKPTILEVASKDEERLKLIVMTIKNEFPKVFLNRGRFEMDEHFDDDDFPEKVFSRFVNSDITLDAVRYKKDKFDFTVYSCRPKRIHIKTEFTKSINSRFSDFSLEELTQNDEMSQIYESLISTDLEIK